MTALDEIFHSSAFYWLVLLASIARLLWLLCWPDD